MSIWVKFHYLVEFCINFGGVVELFPEEGSVDDFFFMGHGLPDVSLFEGVFDDCGIVSWPHNVQVFVLLGFAFHTLGSF